LARFFTRAITSSEVIQISMFKRVAAGFSLRGILSFSKLSAQAKACDNLSLYQFNEHFRLTNSLAQTS
jgi:hypothetical protein